MSVAPFGAFGLNKTIPPTTAPATTTPTTVQKTGLAKTDFPDDVLSATMIGAGTIER